MKITRNEFERVYNPKLNNSNASQNKKEISSTGNSDKIELSSSAKEYTIIKGFIVSAAKDASKAVPTEELLKLKNSIADGSYKVSSEEIAGTILK